MDIGLSTVRSGGTECVEELSMEVGGEVECVARESEVMRCWCPCKMCELENIETRLSSLTASIGAHRRDVPILMK